MSEGTRSAQRINRAMAGDPYLLDRVDTHAITTPIRMVGGRVDLPQCRPMLCDHLATCKDHHCQGHPRNQAPQPTPKTLAELEAEAEDAAYDLRGMDYSDHHGPRPIAEYHAEQARISRHLRIAAGLGIALLIGGAAWLWK